MTKKSSVRYIDIDDTGGNYSISNNYFLAQVDKHIIRIANGDTGTLTGDVTITATNAEDGIYYEIEFEDSFVLGANNFNIFGEALTATQVLAKPTVTVRDDGSGYEVYVQANSLLLTTSTNNIEDEAVTLAKLADLVRGSVIIGGTSNRPTAVDAKTSGRILVGDGTDLLSVAVSGDATLSSAGALTIANDAVNNNKLANIPRGSVKVGGASNAPTDLDVSANGAFLIGDGTDVNAVVMSGAGTLSNTGVFAHAVDSVTNTILANIPQGSVKVGGAANAPTDLDNSTSGAIIIGNGTGVTSQVLTGAITLNSAGLTTIVDDAVVTAKILDDNVTVDKVSTNLKYDTINFEASFETGELGATKIKLPFGGTLDNIYGFATKAIEATNNGTITVKNHAGLTLATITATAGDIRTTEYNNTPASNNVFAIEQYITVETSKANAGGKVLLQMRVLKS